eukprot:91783-Pelagomonas_calceolata.AAC.1
MLFVPRHSSQVNNAWEAFTTQLQQFDASLEDQKQQLGVAVTKQLEEFRSLAERIEQGQRGRVFLYLGGPEAQRRSILVPYCLINGHPSAWAIRQSLPLAGQSSSLKATDFFGQRCRLCLSLGGAQAQRRTQWQPCSGAQQDPGLCSGSAGAQRGECQAAKGVAALQRVHDIAAEAQLCNIPPV